MSRLSFTRLTSGAMIVVLTYTPLLGSFTGTLASAQTVPVTATRYQYDLGGNLTQITDPLERMTNLAYDQLNRVKQVEQPLTNGARPTIKYGYDGIDQVAKVTDPRNLETRYSLDGLGNRSELASPDTGLTKSTYDAAGNLKTRIDGRGKTNTYFYDALNRLTRIDYTGTISTTFEYDGGATPTAPSNAAGKMTLMTDESGYTRYTYGAFGRLATKAQTTTGLGSYTNTHTFAYAYDVGGRLASVTYPSGNRVNYGYNGAGQVTSITLNPVDAGGTGTSTSSIILLNNITYAPFGGTTGWTWGNSTQASENKHVRTYDLDGRISSYTLGNPSANGVVRTVNYDVASRIKGYTHTGTGTAPSPLSLNQTFGYDELDRLTSYSGNGTSQTYAYDASGNRIKAGFGANSYTNTIDPLSNKLSATTGPGPAKKNDYNGAGDLTTDGTHVVTYSGRGRPYRNQNGAVTTHQLFNGLDQRVFQTYGGGIFVYDEQGQLVGEYSYLNGKATRETVYLGNLPVAVLTQTVTGTAPAQSTAINVFHIHPDHLGTPRMITRAHDNKIVWRWDNGDPFGLTPPTEYFSGSGTFTFNLRMPGQYYDRSTNLLHNYHRDYDPQTGRYIQSDPIGLDGGINTYSYVENGPLDGTDEDGLQRRGGNPRPSGPTYSGRPGSWVGGRFYPTIGPTVSPYPFTYSQNSSRQCGPCMQVYYVASTAGGNTRPQHRSGANDQLYEHLTSLGSGSIGSFSAAGIRNQMTGYRDGALRNPAGFAWHHPVHRPQEIWLIRQCDHQNPAFRDWLHPLPNGGGGMLQNFGQGL